MNTQLLYWFASDGSYGGGAPHVTDTSRWTDTDWDNITEATDTRRLDIARQITDRIELEQYLEGLHASLEVEVDLHGSRTERARDIRLAIIATEKELQEIKES
jgi:DNA-nicking Smr family endonuclease